MKQLRLEPDFDAWRDASRDALHAGYLPEELDLQDATVAAPLVLFVEAEEAPHGLAMAHPRVTRAFLEAAKLAAAHRDPQRWNLLYRVLYRMQSEPELLTMETDADVVELMQLEAQVRRDLQRMQAFVRFHKVLDADDPAERPVVVEEPVLVGEAAGEHHLLLEVPTPFGPVQREIEQCEPPEPAPDACEHFIAWYRPEQRIVSLAAPFFAERFAILRWTIMTPEASVSWDPGTKQLQFGPGVPREEAPADEELEEIWRGYIQMRLSAQANHKKAAQMSLLPDASGDDAMATSVQGKPSAQPYVPLHATLKTIGAALPTCRGCDLYRHAIQVVPGRGAGKAALMLVGEQPGDQEDKQGEPFVGPAGGVLDRMLEELRIPRAEVFVTNAVKHFKFVQRGKLRLHQNPRMSEIGACRPWLLAEIAAVKPKVVLCLGASASKSLLGGTFSLMKDHGKLIASPYMDKVMATIHPSAILRARDEESRQQMKHFLAEDLALAWKLSLE
jgi:uracil-DNA glycosylase family protein